MTDQHAPSPHHQAFIDAALPKLIEIAARQGVLFTPDHERLEHGLVAFVLACTDELSHEPSELARRLDSQHERTTTDGYASLRFNQRAFVDDLVPELLRIAAFHRVDLTLDNRHIEEALAGCIAPGNTELGEVPVHSSSGRIIGYEHPTTGATRYRTGRPSIKR